MLEKKEIIKKVNAVLVQIIEGKTASLQLDEMMKGLSGECEELANTMSQLIAKVNESHEFVLALSAGKLSVLPPRQNQFIAPLKQLHSDLLHLTWQTKEIAEGDYSQKVSFMGDFSVAFNKMIEALKERKKLEDSLKESNATKDKFFSIIAHDLINPMGAFVSLTQSMLDNFENKDRENIRENLHAMHNSSKSTFALLENLLTWSRSQRGTIPFNPLNSDLKFVALQCISTLKEVADKKAICLQLEIADSLMSYCDVNMVTTVIRNLMSNAIKFTPENGTITIRGTHHAESKLIQLCIEDTGVGISPENVSKLFFVDQSFTTNGTNNEKGTGLGLILCKEFIKRNEGEIWVESEEGKGSRFCFTLPESTVEEVDLSGLFMNQ
ncbi:MAG: HAMP domain-containing histidine kinase [Bacteroidales bacterium]|nr:HAMP domain-containing histidine kinase [Bacteroidales bacterium]MCF8402389.1 HAMP domain-containing histidine kinase [Bacteroidales bacterium]